MSIFSELEQRVHALVSGVESAVKADERIVADIIAQDRVALQAALQTEAEALIAQVKAATPEIEALAKAAVKDVVAALLAKLPVL